MIQSRHASIHSVWGNVRMLLQLGPSLPTLLHSHLDHSLHLRKRSIDIQISLKQFWFKSYRLLEAIHILSTVTRPRSAPSARTFAPHSSPPRVLLREILTTAAQVSDL